MLKRLIVAACLLVVGSGSAFANLLSFETVLTGPFPLSSPIPFSLQGFDPAWGTLEQVWLETHVLFSGDATFTNPDTVPWPASATLRLLGAIQGDGWGQIVDDYFAVGSLEFTPPGGSQTIHFYQIAGNPFVGPGGPVPAFVTSGLVPGEFRASLGAVDAYAGWLPDIENAQVDSLAVSVFYEYEPVPSPCLCSVPEPSCLLLLSAGLAGLTAKFRRRMLS
jgi:hypothetical protein